MEHLQRVAYESVARACGFAGLAIFTTVMGLIWDPLLAMRTGGTLATITTLVLLIRSRRALTQDHRRTEMWIMLPKDQRPPEAYAQWVSATVLRDAYLYFAQWAAAVSIAFWALAIALSLFGKGGEAEFLMG